MWTGDTYVVDLTRAEVEYLALLMPEAVHGRSWRMFLLEQCLLPEAVPTVIATFEVDDLWAIDTALMAAGPRGAKLPDGESVLGLVRKIWAALVAAEGGAHDARDEDHYTDADEDADRAPAR